MDANEVAQYLRENHDFFDRHAELFAIMKVPHPHEGRAVSLAERQVLTLRERTRSMEQRVSELVRAASENEHISDRLLLWSRSLLKARDPLELPGLVTAGLAETFSVPDVTLRIWGESGVEADAQAPWRAEVSADAKAFANGLMSPYCGPNSGFEAAGWLEREVRSMALIPLRIGIAPEAFGLLVLASPDAERFTPSMGTAFLSRIGELASAALSRLL
ncbi:hypothetical protein PIGHUM_00065 [Pigmentiphaga humi]|uniref:DUF484 domain-containing protein n=1 Tax=Pigmentiphaga humi TaxID=2478468 RepID=A0A3P4AX39_9BURK|nr:DUF484 family protein [Pigmentiphaga humi]VCU68018.1 hypothetical protein PIGHUM_00065 [Pigmentiphaga humi]